MDETLLTVLLNESSSTSSSNNSSSSSSDSSSNDGFNPLLEEDDYENDLLFPLLHFLIDGRERQRVQNFLETVDAKSDEEFREDFRLKRPIVNILLGNYVQIFRYGILMFLKKKSWYIYVNIFAGSLDNSGFIPTHTFGKEKKPAELCLLMTLWFLGNKESHRLLSNLFDISLSSVFRIVRRVIDWIITLVPQFIKWPEGNNLVRISERFENVAGIRGCIGAIDGSHIHINKPEGNGRVYFNRKQHYSILLQAVVDCDLKFTNVYCGDPGSFHDARMLRRSDLFVAAEQNRERIFPNNSFLLGDKGYNGVAQTWLVCPFRDNGNLTVQEDEFNTKISKTRVVVERAFGILKGRFRLLQMMPLRDIQFTIRVIVACCVLHNICFINGDNGEGLFNDELDQQWNDISDNEDVNEDRDVPQRDPRNLRGYLFNNMFPENI